ncbi:MAG: N-acetylmuramoyl-L-alanine amidase [Vicinamibacterales bacterium]
MKVLLRFAALSLVLAAAMAAQQPAVYTILSRDGRKPLPFRVQGGQEMFTLADLAAAFGVTVREDVAAGGIIVTTPQNRTIVLTPGQALASVNGRVVSLPSAPVRDGRVWLVPVEFVTRALGPALNTRLDLRKPSHLIVAGDLRVPDVAVSVEGDAAQARVNIDIAPSMPRAVTQEGQRLIVRIEADAIDLRLSQPDNREIVAGVRAGDTPQTVVVELGPKAAGFQMSVQPGERGAERVVIAVPAQGALPQMPVPPAVPVEPPPLPDFSVGGIRTIVVDPGHGGDDPGARGPGGIDEKSITLAIGHRLKAALEARLGVRVLLTRDGDRAMRIDERTALANNNKADLFISLHANATVTSAPAGAAVFTLALEGYAPEAQPSAAPAQSLPVFGGGARSIEIIPWDTAQIRWLADSERLAGLVHAELGARVTMHPRALDKAPLRVLIGANMPAVLVEAGFLTNPEQEKALAGDALQNEIAQALVAAILRYRDGHSASSGQGSPPGGGR